MHALDVLGDPVRREGNAGGEIRKCVPPSGGAAGYSITWGMGQGEPAMVHIRLKAVDSASTRVELKNVASVDSLPEGMWEQFGPSTTGMGWDSGFLGLAQYYSGGEDGITPEKATEWVASPEGKACADQRMPGPPSTRALGQTPRSPRLRRTPPTACTPGRCSARQRTT